ncbi:site-specific integrase [Halolamina sp. CBA1230]|uniref:tyrosine-type recombinase/integrase n=1 Tax=Halolamina sp. CBA1230 TaxID=1853690 RepID=UPI0009A1B4C2|nr:site-specific integrase [Halolamina sp. CBA1230]QKY20673.1 site-specific integrase [Halolamina sp. CBA1230]
MPPRYKPIDDCRPLIVDYAEELAAGTDDADNDKRDSNSTKRYEQDLRWFDGWLDDQGIDEVTDVTAADANRLGRTLSNEFSGTTGRYRWDRIVALYDYLESMGIIDDNPLSRWNDAKDEKWGLTKSNEQDHHLNDGEKYAVDEEDIEAMEEAVEEDRVRNQLLIRLAWHSACRRGELAAISLDMLDENKREITLPASVTKNNRKRVVGYNRSLDGLLHRWLHGGLRDEYLGGRDHDHLFVGTRGAPLSGEAINEVIVKAADNAGINRKLYADANSPDGEPNRWKVSSHNVRHGAATRLVNKTDLTDLYSISRYLGHSSVEFTEKRYVEYDPEVGVRGVRDYLPD